MKLTTLFRSAAVAAAVGGAIDPACVRRGQGPAAVLVEAASASSADRERAAALRARLTSSRPDRIDVSSPLDPAAVIVAGQPTELPEVRAEVPISFVTTVDPAARNVSITEVSGPSSLIPGLTSWFSATVTGAGVAGETSVIALEQDGIELGRLDHRWASNMEAFEARLSYTPPSTGVRVMRLVARPVERESTVADNHASLCVAVEDRRLSVLVYEPRPSWATTFVRRTLEAVSLFDVASLTRTSRAVELRAGAPPERLVAHVLDRFDLVIAGAPEDLDANELEALDRFARLRGGTFILVPDRRPAGPYLAVVPAASFEERLLERPVNVRTDSAGLQATELSVPVRLGSTVEVAAGVDSGWQQIPVVVSWPVGAGRGMFAGALDAWRFRDRDEGFAAFWQSLAAAAASASPRPLELAMNPGTAPPGHPVVAQARVRATEFVAHEGRIDVPAVSASLAHPGGAIEPIRVWPTAEPGLFAVRFDAPPRPGRYVISISSGAQAVQAPLVVGPDARGAAPAAPGAITLLSLATGGVVARRGDLTALESHLDALRRPVGTHTVHPARSAWWMAAFTLLLCAEWGIRRRGGRR
jgi:hypothetical protein